MSAVLITACRKEAPGPALPGATSEAAQVNPTPRVKAFIERALAADAKSGGFLSVDSAVWYVEAALNYSMRRTWLDANELILDSMQVVVPVTDQRITAWDAGQAFLALSEALSANDQPGVSHLVVIDVSQGSAGVGLTLCATALVGSGYDKSLNTSYGANDYFMAYGGLSSCGCGPNQGGTGLCADKQIQNRVNFALVHPVNSYWTDIENKQLTASSLPLGGIWQCEGTVFEPCDACFTPSMMAQYTQGTWDVIWFNTPSGKEPIRTTVFPNTFTLPYPDDDIHIQQHVAEARYGINNLPSE
ncbi:MAG: hypothetical protein KIT10_11915 [Flavobacteriales bacterium]|nr:hypothetical protein [Flavobacteriales bacterium]